jgi:hypothetical protein
MNSLRERVAVAAISAVLCIILVRSGILMFMFLSPLGFAGYGYDRRTLLFALFFTLLGNCLLTMGLALPNRLPAGEFAWGILNFSILAASFAWVVCPPSGEDTRSPLGSRFYLSGIYRLVAGSVVCAVFFLLVLRRGFDDPVFHDYLKNQAELLNALYRSTTADVVQRALLENITAERILDTIKLVLFRGGGIVSCVFLFFLSRQVSYILVRLIRRVRVGSPLLSFYASPRLIWATSASLLFILLTRIAKWRIPEIILWNILVVCAILYLAQGLGILQYFMIRPAMPPFLRVILPPLFIVLIVSPGINAVVLGLTILLGIAENWVSFRTSETGGPPSTPAA